jgi:hypothetical protein
MNIMLSAVIAYILCGVAQVANDLSSDPMHRPFWTLKPTLTRIFIAAATWPIQHFQEVILGKRPLGRSIAFACVAVLTQWACLALLVWCAMTLANHFLSQLILRIIAVTVLMIPALLYGVPLMIVLTAPLQLIIAGILDLFFPRKKGT